MTPDCMKLALEMTEPRVPEWICYDHGDVRPHFEPVLYFDQHFKGSLAIGCGGEAGVADKLVRLWMKRTGNTNRHLVFTGEAKKILADERARLKSEALVRAGGSS